MTEAPSLDEVRHLSPEVVTLQGSRASVGRPPRTTAPSLQRQRAPILLPDDAQRHARQSTTAPARCIAARERHQLVGWQARLTRPMRSASAPLTLREAGSRSAAMAGAPTRRRAKPNARDHARRSGRVLAKPVVKWRRWRRSGCRRTASARNRCRRPRRLTHAITGLGTATSKLQRCCSSGPTTASTASLPIVLGSAHRPASGLCLAAPCAAPAHEPRPAPVRDTITRTASSRLERGHLSGAATRSAWRGDGVQALGAVQRDGGPRGQPVDERSGSVLTGCS